MLVMIAAVTGILGAKAFHQLENWEAFMRDPMAALLSFDGLTFYGGLITAAFFRGLLWRETTDQLENNGDAVAPALILAYALAELVVM